jgi:Peptidase M61 N-terminal domain
MKWFRLRLFVFLASVLALAVSGAVADEAILVTVDATRTQLKLLHTPNLTGLKFEANGQTIPWQRDLLDVFTFHLEVPQGVSRLEVNFDYIEPDGISATDKLLVLEWNEVLLYPADVVAEKLTYEAKLVMPDGWKFGTALPVENDAGNQVLFKQISLNLLVDSPVITGEFYRSIDLTPPGEPIHHEIDIAADSADALNMNPENQQEMLNLVAESGKLFGARHYRDYHFLLALSDHVAHFGLEHHESNNSRLPERTLLLPTSGEALGGLLAHEFVHSWNGKFSTSRGSDCPLLRTAHEDGSPLGL